LLARPTKSSGRAQGGIGGEQDAGASIGGKKEILELSKEINSVLYLTYNEQLYIENITK